MLFNAACLIFHTVIESIEKGQSKSEVSLCSKYDWMKSSKQVHNQDSSSHKSTVGTNKVLHCLLEQIKFFTHTHTMHSLTLC